MGVPELPSACFRAAAQWEFVCRTGLWEAFLHSSAPAAPAPGAWMLAPLAVLRPAACAGVQELQMAGINFKAFDLGGHEIARRVWKDYYAKARARRPTITRRRALAPTPVLPSKPGCAWHECAQHGRDGRALWALRWTRLCSWWMRSTGSASPSRRRSWTRC